MATGEGGMLVTNREDIAKKVHLLRSHGMTSLTWDRHQGHAYSYDVVELGYNYRLDEIRSALGLVQLKKLMENNRKRAEITARYWDAFQSLQDRHGFKLPFRTMVGRQDYSPSFHIFPLILPEQIDRSRLVEDLKAGGIQTSLHYPPIHKFSLYRQSFQDTHLPQTEFAASHQVTLPLYPTLSQSSQEIVIAEIRKSLAAQA